MMLLRVTRPDRRELNRMLGKLAPGDVVTVTRIDRLARSTFDLFGTVKRIVDAKAQFRSFGQFLQRSALRAEGRGTAMCHGPIPAPAPGG
jgi:DNA invertase Pin-like site-specific DNA recombinase